MRIYLGDHALNVEAQGPQNAPAVVFGHALGADLTMWDDVVARLPQTLRMVRYDMRGHGKSDPIAAPWSMGQLVRDGEQVIEKLGLKDVVYVGISTSGMVAQGLAIKRLDLVRAIVLSNTAAKIGQPAHWATMIDDVKSQGVAAIAARTAPAWFPEATGADAARAHWQQVLANTPAESLIGGMSAISGTDFYTPTAALRLPCLGIAASHDKITPPDLVRETIDLIPGSQFALMKRSGHVPPIDAPEEYAALLCSFLTEIGHVPQ